MSTPALISLRGITTSFGTNVVHQDLDLDIYSREVLGLIGGSGTGKSVLLHTVLGLIKQKAGEVTAFGTPLSHASTSQWEETRRRWGVLFQDGALFSSLTVSENIQVPLREFTKLSPALRQEIAAIKIDLVGLPQDAGDKYPSELSGGMRKRAGLARALVMDPAIVFLDEPTAGLDPIGAANFDTLITELRKSIGLTVCMITHDLDSLYAICDRVAVLADKKIYASGTIAELSTLSLPWIKEYFLGPRGRMAATSQKRK